MRAAVLALCGLLALVAASSDRVIFYNRTGAPKGWTVGDRADAAATVNFAVAMK